MKNDLTIKDIVHVLPFDDAFKVYILEAINTLDLERKISIERIMWDLYDIILTLKFEENVQDVLEKAKQTNVQVELTDDFYSKIREKTQQEMLSENVTQNSYIDLALTRNRLQQVIGEKDQV